MDPKELRGLMEAYSEVYAPADELYEGYMSPEKKIKPSPTRGGRPTGDMRKPYNDTMRRQDQLAISKGKPYNDKVKKDSPIQYKSNEEYVGEAKRVQMYGQSGMSSDYDERNLKNRGDLSKRDAGSIARSRLKGEPSAVGRVRGSSPHIDGRRINNEEVDFYDIVLSYLLDEGYAETAEAAEAIMVNMSEEWRDSILDEAYVDYRRGKLPSGRTPQQAAKGRESALKARQKKDEVLGKGSNPETYQQRGRLSKQSDTVSQMDRATTLGSRFLTRGNPGIVRGEPNTGRHQSAITKRDAIKTSKEADKKTRG